jgi:hypothetical protein
VVGSAADEGVERLVVEGRSIILDGDRLLAGPLLNPCRAGGEDAFLDVADVLHLNLGDRDRVAILAPFRT